PRTGRQGVHRNREQSWGAAQGSGVVRARASRGVPIAPGRGYRALSGTDQDLSDFAVHERSDHQNEGARREIERGVSLASAAGSVHPCQKAQQKAVTLRSPPASGRSGSISIALSRRLTDDEEVARPDGGAGEVVSGLEGFQGDAKTARHLFQGISHTDLIPAGRVGRGELRLREGRGPVRRNAVERLFHPGC